MPDAARWMLFAAPSLLLINWMAVLLGVAALAWHRREGRWPRWGALAPLDARIAANPRTRRRTLWMAIQLLLLDLLAPLALIALK